MKLTAILLAAVSAALLPRAALSMTASTEYVDDATNAALRAANAYTDAHGGGVDTNAVRDIVRPIVADATNAATNYTDAATNALCRVDGAARPLPKYLHALSFDDPYPDDAAWYYSQRSGEPVGCSAVREGGFLYRNFDFPFDDRAEFVVKMSAGPNRFASVGVAQVGTNLTEAIVTSGKPSRYYKALPGATVDGINENGVVAEINVVDGDPQTSGWHTHGDIHPLGAVRWALDRGESAAQVASNLAERIAFPAGWAQNYHYMIADETETWIVENGTNYLVSGRAVMTNFRLYPSHSDGAGQERYALLGDAWFIKRAWFTNAYRRETNPPWVSDLKDVLAYTNDIFNAWASHPKEYFRNKTTNGQPWWQTVHTSIYDITNRVLRIAVQEQDDWYTFALPKNGTDEEEVRRIAQEEISAYSDDSKYDKTGGDVDGYVGAYWFEGESLYIELGAEIGYLEVGGPLEVAGQSTFKDTVFIEDGAHLSVSGGIDANGTVGGNYVIANEDVQIPGIASLKSVAGTMIRTAKKVDGATAGNLASLTATGDLADSGISSVNYAAVSNAAMSAISTVTNAEANLIYTITSQGESPRFFFTPIGAINPED